MIVTNLAGTRFSEAILLAIRPDVNEKSKRRLRLLRKVIISKV